MVKQHVIAFFENQDGGGTHQELAALVDPLAPNIFALQDADTFRVDARLRFIAAIHAHVDQTAASRAELRAPSFKTRYNGRSGLDIPRLSSTAEPASPPVINDYRAKPIEVEAGDLLSYRTTNNPATAADQFTVLYMADGPIQPVSADGGYWVRHTVTAAALTANTWGSRALTPDENYRPGNYEVLAGLAMSTSLIAARLSFPLGDHYRPGIGAVDSPADIVHPMFHPGQMGVLGTFAHDNLPTVELLVDAADNEAQVVFLYVRPVGGARNR